jgi:hypothetical protein
MALEFPRHLNLLQLERDLANALRQLSKQKQQLFCKIAIKYVLISQ